jgi:hypothetical protein
LVPKVILEAPVAPALLANKEPQVLPTELQESQAMLVRPDPRDFKASRVSKEIQV